MSLFEKKELEFDFEFKGDYRLPDDAYDSLNLEIEHSNEEFSDLEVIIWMEASTNREFYQSARASYNEELSLSHSSKDIDLILYPNPVNDELFIAGLSLASLTNLKIDLINSIGQVATVSTEIKDIESLSISTSHLKNGHYFLRISHKEGIITRPFIVNH